MFQKLSEKSPSWIKCPHDEINNILRIFNNKSYKAYLNLNFSEILVQYPLSHMFEKLLKVLKRRTNIQGNESAYVLLTK